MSHHFRESSTAHLDQGFVRSHSGRAGERMQIEQLSVGLGLFSIGLGLVETFAPDSVARFIGVPVTNRTRTTLRALGAREMANGAAILADPGRATWLWTRVGGDAVDLTMLGTAIAGDTTDRRRATGAIAVVVGAAALDAWCAVQLDRQRPQAARHRRRDVEVEHVATINRPIEEVYRFWRDFQNFPRFMRHLESVEVLDERRSRWRATAPAGFRVEWQAAITDDRPNDSLAWRSLEGSDVDHSGEVTFRHAPGARGTEVRVRLQYAPPAGTIGRGIAKLFGEEPEQQVRDDLRRFKQLVETGEIPLSDGPGLRRPAQPTGRAEDITKLAGVQQ